MYEDLIYLNSAYLKALNPKKYFLPILTIILFLILLIFSFIKEVYDIKNYIGYISCEETCKVDITVNLNEISKIKDANYLIIDNKKLNIINKKISEVMVDKDHNFNYQVITYEVDNVNFETMFYDIKIYYNKELIIKKIYKIFLESE